MMVVVVTSLELEKAYKSAVGRVTCEICFG